MAKAKDSRELRDIKIKEVSLVDSPANKIPFLFFKNQDGARVVNKQKNPKIVIESDGSVDGTNISINGEALNRLKSFDFGFYESNDPKASIHASYSIATESDSGFSRTENYYLSKGEMTMDKILKVLQAYLGTEEVDFEKRADEEEIAKAIELINEHYKEDFPEDLHEAIGTIAKRAAGSFDVEKVGAKFSKDVLKKIRAIVRAMQELESMLPTSKSQSNDDNGVTKGADSTGLEDLTKKLADLEEVLKGVTEEPEKEKNEQMELTKAIQALSDRIKSLEDGGAVKKSIEDDGGSDDGNNKKPLWPSLSRQK